MNPKHLFTEEEQQNIIHAIEQAERNTSGEIRVHVEKKCIGIVEKRVEEIFVKLEMHKTVLRNGILFYVATDTHDFFIAGDAGIHQKVGQDFWEKIRDKTIDHFKHRRFAEGLIDAIHECGIQLKEHFPYHPEDKNELPNDISFDV